jgi:hypothetical protein
MAGMQDKDIIKSHYSQAGLASTSSQDTLKIITATATLPVSASSQGPLRQQGTGEEE